MSSLRGACTLVMLLGCRHAVGAADGDPDAVVASSVLLDGLASAAGCAGSGSDSWPCLLKAAGGLGADGCTRVLGRLREHEATYGEILPEGVAAMLEAPAGVPIGIDDIFLDVGSGCGSLVAQAFVMSSAGTSIGVELYEQRHAEAAKLREGLLKMVSGNSELAPLLHGRELVLLNGDARALADEWAHATVMVTNSLAFGPELLDDLRELALELVPGTVVMSTRRFSGCRSDILLQLSDVNVPVSWRDSELPVQTYLRVPRRSVFPVMPAISKEISACTVRLPEVDSRSAKRLSAAARICGMESWKNGDALPTMRCAEQEFKHLAELERWDRVRAVAAIPDFRDVRDLDNNNGLSMLHMLAAKSDPSMAAVVKVLAGARADVNAVDISRRTPLHYAATPQVVQSLLDDNAELEAKDDLAMTPLMVALKAKRFNPDVLDAFLEKNANVNMRDKGKRTPLHLASARLDDSAPHIVSRLLDLRAATDVSDLFDMTPAEHAQRPDVMELLVSRPEL